MLSPAKLEELRKVYHVQTGTPETLKRLDTPSAFSEWLRWIRARLTARLSLSVCFQFGRLNIHCGNSLIYNHSYTHFYSCGQIAYRTVKIGCLSFTFLMSHWSV